MWGFFSWLFNWLRDLLCRWLGLFCRCKDNPPPRTCPIAWQPSVLAPVFYGARDMGAADGAPGPCRVFFPSLDGAVFDAPILSGCARYPLIIFFHGHCAEAEHYKKWFEIPATLARSGCVVVVPELPQVGGGVHPSGADADLELVGKFEEWMRGSWEHRAVLQAPPATGVLGHSFGALLAGRYAQVAAVGAYASLSGVWQDWPDSNAPIKTLRIPKFFTWGDPLLDLFTEINTPSWTALPPNKHRAVFSGGAHWDYLRAGRTTCETGRGDCPLVHVVAGDLVATFFGKYLPPECWPALTTCIPDSLVAPPYNLTMDQEFYAGGHLMGLKLMQGQKSCQVQLAWTTSTGSGSVTKP
ncbi:MAG: alpha/beta fold hydrolase [Tepidiformaceae bacterium]